MAGLVSARPPAPRPHSRGASRFAVLCLLACGGSIAFAPAMAPILDRAMAQELKFPQAPPAPKKSKIAIDREKSGDKQMLVQAVEVDYDYNNRGCRRSATCRCYYNGTSHRGRQGHLRPEDQAAARRRQCPHDRCGRQDHLRDIMDLSDDYRDGFVDSLRVDTADQTRMAATRADRTSGNYTVFRKRRLHRLRPLQGRSEEAAAVAGQGRAHHSRPRREDAVLRERQLEFFGVPMAYLPYFSTPDPTVKRKTGVLVPSVSSSSIYGGALEVPYYWALAPDYDATFSPMITTKQGSVAAR
jgi:LPS-assembly protein